MSGAPSDPESTLWTGQPLRREVDLLHGLVVVEGGEPGRTFVVGDEPVVLGRDLALPCALPDAEVSRRHCELRRVGERVLVRDLGSTNGTYVGAERVAGELPLPVGALLLLGRHVLRHELVSAAELARQEELARELERARRYVQALLPPPLAAGPVRTEYCFEPCAHLGGDALGYHALDDGLLALYVIDVCGHGVGSAMHSATVVNVLRGRAFSGADAAAPGEVLATLNRAFPMEGHGGMYLTAWYGVLDPASGRLDYASAGHPPALVVGPGEPRPLATRNPPIGTFGPRPFKAAQDVLRPGERLYLFSDGVYELVDGEGRERGYEDFARELADPAADRSPGEPRRRYDAARRAARGERLEDDFTLLVVTRERTP